MAMPIGELQGLQRPARPRRAAVPAMPEMDALDRTHRRMLDMLAQMATLMKRLDDGDNGAEARRIAHDLCRFFAREARQHHADEERLVFPQLVARGDAVLTHHVLRLQQDHGWLEEDWFQIEPHLQALAQGYGGCDVDLLRHALPVFDALLREHIALEESMIYPAARAART
ncbi:MAG: hemerythrin domain-containing protein [Aquabacterium sp.]